MCLFGLTLVILSDQPYQGLHINANIRRFEVISSLCQQRPLTDRGTSITKETFSAIPKFCQRQNHLPNSLNFFVSMCCCCFCLFVCFGANNLPSYLWLYPRRDTYRQYFRFLFSENDDIDVSIYNTTIEEFKYCRK